MWKFLIYWTLLPALAGALSQLVFDFEYPKLAAD